MLYNTLFSYIIMRMLKVTDLISTKQFVPIGAPEYKNPDLE